jgi:hypothetical protein
MRRWLLLAIPLIALAALASPGGRASAAPTRSARRVATIPNGPFTLASVDRACFYATPGPARGWPWADRNRTAPIRGSFNEVRTLAGSHFGVDVAAPANGADVYAIAGGTVLDRTKHTMEIGDSPGHHWIYWHLQSTTGWHKGMIVHHRELLGQILRGYYHVHISEWVSGCGYVDPRRPTGNFWNPNTTQRPFVGPLAGFAADPAAWAEPPSVFVAPPLDPAQPESLADLHGVVDLRAVAMVPGPPTPINVVGGTAHIPDLAVSAIRAWLTTPNLPTSHIEMRTIMDGARLVSGPGIWHRWAWGTWRANACFYGFGACSQTMVWHVAGPHGLDTRAYPNGRYLYCVSALTIDNRAATHCSEVSIKN